MLRFAPKTDDVIRTWRNPTKTIEHVSPKSKEEICLLYAKGIRNKDKIKRKLISISSHRLERRSPVILFGTTPVDFMP